MTGAEWGVTQYKHLDHHLGQFGQVSPWRERGSGSDPPRIRPLRLNLQFPIARQLAAHACAQVGARQGKAHGSAVAAAVNDLPRPVQLEYADAELSPR